MQTASTVDPRVTLHWLTRWMGALEPAELRLALYLADSEHFDAAGFPASRVNELAEAVGVSREYLQKCLRRMVKYGLLRRLAREGRISYVLNTALQPYEESE